MRGERSAHILCECEALASLRHVNMGSFLLEPEDIRILDFASHQALWKDCGAPMIRYGTQSALSNQGLGASGLRGPVSKCKSFNQGGVVR